MENTYRIDLLALKVVAALTTTDPAAWLLAAAATSNPEEVLPLQHHALYRTATAAVTLELARHKVLQLCKKIADEADAGASGDETLYAFTSLALSYAIQRRELCAADTLEACVRFEVLSVSLFDLARALTTLRIKQEAPADARARQWLIAHARELAKSTPATPAGDAAYHNVISLKDYLERKAHGDK